MAQCEHCGEGHPDGTRFCPITGQIIASRIFFEGALLEGKYRIGRLLGEGGMGAVFDATHTLLDKRVAIKVLIPRGGVDMDQMTARLVREARAASSTGHPNIALVTDMGKTEDGSLFVVMEFIDGITLNDLVEQTGPMTHSRASGLIRQVLSGLEAVHRKGIIHRDLKPENLMIMTDDEGRELVKILDFGISKVTSSDEKLNLTATGFIMGTPQFMSPEQARGDAEIDHRTDIYSLGAIHYLLLTGTVPHEQDALNALIAATLSGKIEPPSARGAKLPGGLERVIMTALALQPKHRFPAARAYYDALTPFVSEGADDMVPSAQRCTGNWSAVAQNTLESVNFDKLVNLDERESAPSEDRARAGAGRAADRLAAAGSAFQSFPPMDDDDDDLSSTGVRKPPPSARSAQPARPAQPVRSPRPTQATAGGEAMITDLAALDDFSQPSDRDYNDVALDLDEPRSSTAAHSAPRAPAARAEPDVDEERPRRNTGAGGTPARAAVPFGQARKSKSSLPLILGAVGVLAALGGGFLLFGDKLLSAGAGGGVAAQNSQIEIRFAVLPENAEIKIDDVLLTSQPLVLERSQREYKVTVEAPHCLSQSVFVRADATRTVTITLRRSGESSGPEREE